jgi:hypothetical protein
LLTFSWHAILSLPSGGIFFGAWAWSADVKEQCATLAAKGMSLREIEAETAVPFQTIQSWGIKSLVKPRDLPEVRQREKYERFTDEDKEKVMQLVLLYRIPVAQVAEMFNSSQGAIYELKLSDDPVIVRAREQHRQECIDRIYGGLPQLIDRTLQAAVGDVMQGSIAVEKLTNSLIMLQNMANVVTADGGKKTLADFMRAYKEHLANQPRTVGGEIVDSVARPKLSG